MNFYFDENIPFAIARSLNELEKERTENSVQSTVDVWGAGIKDPQLIEKLNVEDGILVTNDLKMRREHYELLKLHKVSVFYIVFPSGVDFEFRFRQIAKNWETIKKIASNEKRPFICRIQNNGKATIL
jgi:hypothetical protein